MPSRKLRGFESGKVGPKDGDDFIGGNYLTAINVTTTIPQFLENAQNMDFLVFFDAANVWGIDYDSTLDDSSKIRSSIGMESIGNTCWSDDFFIVRGFNKNIYRRDRII